MHKFAQVLIFPICDVILHEQEKLHIGITMSRTVRSPRVTPDRECLADCRRLQTGAFEAGTGQPFHAGGREALLDADKRIGDRLIIEPCNGS
jgi:hypothetical protein